MKAAEFDYVRPETLEVALGHLADQTVEARAIAGGQSLMAMMNFRLAQPERLVDLAAIEALRFLRDEGERIEVGAMTTFAELERSPIIADHVPLLAVALPHIAHPAIRSRGTIGGSAALADPAAEVPALLLALDATLDLVSATASRSVEARDFFVDTYQTDLAAGELVRSISIPKRPPGARHAFYELARRHGDYAMAGVAVTVDAIRPVANLRVAFFAIGDAAVRVQEAEDAMNGRDLADADAVQAALAGVAQLAFRGDLNATAETKRHLAQVVLKRAFAELGK